MKTRSGAGLDEAAMSAPDDTRTRAAIKESSEILSAILLKNWEKQVPHRLKSVRDDESKELIGTAEVVP